MDNKFQFGLVSWSDCLELYLHMHKNIINLTYTFFLCISTVIISYSSSVGAAIL